MGDYRYLRVWSLLACGHPAEWVQLSRSKMKIFKGKGLPAPEYGSGICKYLLGQKGVVGESPIATTLHNMFGDTVKFLYSIDVR